MDESDSLFEKVTRFFEKNEFNFSRIEGQPMLTMGWQGDNGSWGCLAQVTEDNDTFIFYSRLETKVPEARRAAIAEFLTRANYGLILGNFEMDYSDGEIRYKTSIGVADGNLTDDMLLRMVGANVLTLDRYFQGIMKVIYTRAQPEKVIRDIES
jgi:hypothetical protein